MNQDVLQQTPQTQTQQAHTPHQTININVGDQTQSTTESYFDGTLLQLVGVRILAFFVTILTVGIAFPWGFVRAYRWETEHTVINGRRLGFSGTATGLFGHWIKWLLLSLITGGIYLFWVGIKLRQWKTMHTYVA